MSECIMCHINVLSPVHLGCDEVYDPLSFYVDTPEKTLFVFDTTSFLLELPKHKRDNFLEISKKGTPSSILEIYKFFAREKPGGHEKLGRAIAVSDSFARHYEDTLELSTNDNQRIQKELNRFIIERTVFLQATDRPYIPGSAVKGSLRTAYLNFLSKDKNKDALDNTNWRRLEESLLGGSFNTDPFRLVKVSDFMPVGEVRTKIVYAVNEKKKVSEFQPQGPYQILEAIERGAVFQGTITIDQPPPKSGIRNPLKTETLWKSLQDFFGCELERERTELAKIKRKHSVASIPDEGGALLRIGRHSGAESVTVAPVRSILIRGPRGVGRREKGATTFWLAADARNARQSRELMPFGWASLHKTDEETQKAFAEIESTWKQAISIPKPDLGNKEKPTFVEPVERELATEEWAHAHVEWNPGNKEIRVTHGQKKALAKDLEVVDARLRDKLRKKRSIKASVKVSHEGGTYYKILSVEPPGGN